MATKKTSKTNPKTTKKTALKKNTSAKASASGRKSSAKKKTTGKQSTAQVLYYIKRQRFIKGIVLLCLSVLFSLIFFMEGEKVWKSLHECYRGLFGFLGFMLPIIMIYCAVQMFREQSTYRFPLKVFFFSGTVIMLSTVVFAFSSSGMELGDYGTELMICFNQGSVHTGTGFIGGIIGIPLAKIFGAVAGGILAFLIFLFFLYMSFEALFMNLIDKIKEPVSERISEHKEIRTKVREEKSKIKAEEKQKNHEEYVNRKVDEKLRAARQKATESEFRRIDKTPIYEPEHTVRSSTKTVTPTMSEERTSSDLDGLIPSIEPKNKTKNRKQESPVNMEHVSDETEISADMMDIASLVNKERNKKKIPVTERKR